MRRYILFSLPISLGDNRLKHLDVAWSVAGSGALHSPDDVQLQPPPQQINRYLCIFELNITDK